MAVRQWSDEQRRKHAESIAARNAAKAAGVPWIAPSVQAAIDARLERERKRAKTPPTAGALRMQAWRDRQKALSASLDPTGEAAAILGQPSIRTFNALKNKVRAVERRNAVLAERLNRLEQHVRVLESLQIDEIKAKTRRKADNSNRTASGSVQIGSNRAKSSQTRPKRPQTRPNQSKPRQIA